jgi:hypothetical protein
MLPLASTRSSARRGAVAVLALMLVSAAACSDAATAPTVPNVASASADRMDQGLPRIFASVKVVIIDTTGAPIKEGGSWVKFNWGGAADTATIVDNSAKDSDPSPGFMTVQLPKVYTYSACFLGSRHYAADLLNAAKWPNCRQVSSTSSTVHVGGLFSQVKPVFKLISKDEFGNPAGGALYSVTIPNSNWSLSFYDGSFAYDESAGIDGVVIYTMNAPFSVQTCQASPPPKMELTSTKCFNFSAKWGGVYTSTFTNQHLLY